MLPTGRRIANQKMGTHSQVVDLSANDVLYFADCTNRLPRIYGNDNFQLTKICGSLRNSTVLGILKLVTLHMFCGLYVTGQSSKCSKAVQI